MKRSLGFLIAWALYHCTVLGIAPQMQVPPAPPISAIKAIELADDFLAKKFPKDNSLYCQNAHLVDAVFAPIGGEQHWELVYRQSGAERKVSPRDGKESFNDFHAYVTMASQVSLEWPVKNKTDKLEPAPVKGKE